MKKILFLLLASGLALPVMAQKNKKSVKPAAAAPAAETAAGKEGSERERAAMMGRMIGPMHHYLVQWNGHWQEETSVFSPSGKKTATYVSMRDGRIMMEGLFLVSEIRGERASHHYEAGSVIGWDNARMVFVKTWYDNTSSSILTLDGTLDQEKNTVEFKGTTADPLTRQPVQIRQVLKMTDATHSVLEIYMTEKGQEYKAMEVTSVRM